MPTYQYRCPDCAHEFELRQAFSDDPVTTCPTEGCAGAVRKVFSSVGISFKGDGFYKNDHGSSSGTRHTSTDSPDSSSSKSSSESSNGTSDPSGGATEKAPAASSTSTSGSSD